MKLNIIYIIANPQLYGSEKHLLGIVEYMKCNYNLKVIALHDGLLLSELDKLNVDYVVINIGYFFSLRRLIDVKKNIMDFKANIIHAHQPKALFIGVLVSLMSKIPLISTIHSRPKDQAIVNRGLRKVIVFLGHFFLDIIVQIFSKKIIYVSKYMFKKHLFPNKSILINNWLEEKIIEDSKKNNYEHKKNKKVIRFLSVGSVTYAKGYDLLFKFAENLKELKNEKFEYNILGDIDNQFLNSLKKSYSKENFDEFKFLGYLSDKKEYYKTSDFFILFSRTETFGLAYLEAMAFGLPIIALDIPVLKEFVPPSNSISNDLKEHVNYIIRVLNDSKLCKEIFYINKEIAINNFSYIKSMEKLENLYFNCI